MELRLISNYKSNDVLRESYIDFAKEIFGIDLKTWYDLGFWNEQYIQYSIADGNKIVSNVSVFKFSAHINGENVKMIQLGAVATLKEYRGQGLADRLLKTVITEYTNHCDLILLYANEGVKEFYPKFGFKLVKESIYDLHISECIKPSKYNMVKLDMSNLDDLNLLKEKILNKTSLSNEIQIDQAECVNMWHYLNIVDELIYYIEDLDVIVIYEIKDNMLHMYDLIIPIDIRLNTLLPFITNKAVSTVRFYFKPDRLVETESLTITESDELLFVQGRMVGHLKNFKIPITSQT
jgi:predicted GNAT family N-acyltransferase